MTKNAASRPKILFVAPAAYPLGGVQVWLNSLLHGLPNFGWETHLALTEGRFHDVGAYLARNPFDATTSIAAPTGTRQGRVDAICNTIDAINPDLVVGVNIADVYGAVAQRRSDGATKVKAVATLHGVQADFLADFRSERSVIDAVVCTNRLSQRLVVDNAGVDPRRVLYAPYGVTEAQPSDRRRGSRRKDSALTLAYVGRLEQDQKRIRDLVLIVEAAQKAGLEIDLLVAGDGPDRDMMRNEMAARKLETSIHFLGALNAAQVVERVYGRCDALIVTSSWETGPIVAWEAMTQGIPVLTSAYVGSGAEGALVDSENCLMFPVGDIAAAVAKLRVLTEPNEGERLGEAGRMMVARRYTLAKSLEQWDAQLTHVLALPALAPGQRQLTQHGGRLDALLGARFAEHIRRLLGRSFTHSEPGGEWPHAYGVGALDKDAFWATAAQLDHAGRQA